MNSNTYQIITNSHIFFLICSFVDNFHFPVPSLSLQNCLLVTTGLAIYDDGYVDVFVDSGSGFVPVSTSGRLYVPGDIVVDQCFDTIVGVQVRNQNLNGWAGSFDLSTDGKATYYTLICSDCTGTTNTMDIAVDGDASSGSGCLNGRTCTLKVSMLQIDISIDMPDSLYLTTPT